MKTAPITIITNIVGALLGALFVMSAVIVLFKIEIPNMPPPPPPDSLAGKFMGSVGATNYMTMVKVFELLGGILVAIPKTRNFGLLVLGPIIINILAFHFFLTDGKGLYDKMLIGIVVMTLFLLWTERKKFLGLLR